MKKIVEKYRPVRQKTVRGKTTTDKAGSTDELAPQHVKQLTFVDDSSINERPPQVEKYETDSEDGTISSSGMPVRARFGVDV